jgi:hypothetical protein
VGSGSRMDYTTVKHGIGVSIGYPVFITRSLFLTNTYGLDIVANTSVVSSTAQGNTYGVMLRLNAAPTLTAVNVLTNTTWGLVIEQPRSVTVTNLWWGTTVTTTINGYIRDGVDDIGRGTATYLPVAVAEWTW